MRRCAPQRARCLPWELAAVPSVRPARIPTLHAASLKKMVSSMEAFGILVLEACQANGLSYYYGSDKIAYTACFLLP